MKQLARYLEQSLGQVLTRELMTGVLQRVPRLASADSIFHITPPPASSANRLIKDQSARFIDWVAQQCASEPWSHAYGMGMLDEHGEILCAVVLEDYNGANASIHVAGVGGHWCNRHFLHGVFDYAFHQLKLKRLTGLVAQDNQAALRFDLRLGFQIEHVLKDAHPNGDIYMLVMRPEDCRYLPEKLNG